MGTQQENSLKLSKKSESMVFEPRPQSLPPCFRLAQQEGNSPPHWCSLEHRAPSPLSSQWEVYLLWRTVYQHLSSWPQIPIVEIKVSSNTERGRGSLPWPSPQLWDGSSTVVTALWKYWGMPEDLRLLPLPTKHSASKVGVSLREKGTRLSLPLAPELKEWS